ncbi:MAG: aldehyde ferredoxin oxidoreductase C-terminal domain-containing protein, partial [Candidatus Bathyarchaeia archaeon]
ENQASLGTNLGIFEAAGNIYITALADDLGFCGIQVGNVLAFAAELYQRGILTKEDLGGVDLKWGDVEAFAAILEMMTERKGIGDILAEGTYRAALKISEMKGVDVLQYAVTSKGIGIGAHGIRSEEDYPHYVAYACSVQGGDHTSVASLPVEDGEAKAVLYDSGVVCWFNFFKREAENALWSLLEAVTGWKITPEEWNNTMARKILHMQRAALLIGGPDLRWNQKIHDDVPRRWYEPLRRGPYSGKAVDKARLWQSVREYYEAIGWDENGVPRSEELKRLGLDDVDKKLEEVRNL